MVRNVEVEIPSLDQVPMVREFLDVFIEELLRMPPKQEIEFGIDLASNAQPISIPPYRMARAKL